MVKGPSTKRNKEINSVQMKQKKKKKVLTGKNWGIFTEMNRHITEA